MLATIVSVLRNIFIERDYNGDCFRTRKTSRFNILNELKLSRVGLLYDISLSIFMNMFYIIIIRFVILLFQKLELNLVMLFVK